MHHKYVALFLVFIYVFQIPLTIASDEIRKERVSFAKGDNGKTIKNRIKGYESVDYLIKAQANQRLMVTMETSNASSYFNVMAPGKSDEAMFVGSTVGNRFEGPTPIDGDYTIRVYMMRSAARRNETASYTLAVNVFGPGSQVSAPANDFADGFGGGPDFWQVAGVATGDALKLRSEPNSQAKAISHLANGEVLQNQGCKMSGKQRWCKVAEVSGQHLSGWVAGSYLQESGGLDQSKPAAQDAMLVSKDLKGNGKPFHATGGIPCSVAMGQPTRNCSFGVIREGGGSAGVWINISGKVERHILFAAGKPVSSNGVGKLSFEKSGDLFLIRVGDQERYEIPEVVVYGD